MVDSVLSSTSLKAINSEKTAYGPQATKNATTIISTILATWASALRTELVLDTVCIFFA